jgi:UDP-N-acetylglucosamine--N-acetylmuramyl-(pentapeptide) pyrophosphoryl-undecaprenol N-acetylglucosamine transferase
MLKILFVGGGSVGHIAPSVAVWEELKKFSPHSSAHFVCSPRPDDSAFLKKLNIKHTVLDAPRLSVLYPLHIMKAVSIAKKMLLAQKPDIVFSKGGYVSIPVCFVAKRLHIPIVLHESDSVSGYANKIVAKWATNICTGFPLPPTPYSLPPIFTGNPLRADITKGSKEEGLRMTGLSGDKPILLVTGGSQGAQALNDAITQNLDDLLLRCDIIHITGRGKIQNTKYKIQNSHHYYQTEFANDELKHFYACSSIALSRAGAGSIGELSANGIPTILVPLRGVGHDHQYKNAKVSAKNGGCIHLEQTLLSKDLISTVHTLITDDQKREDASQKIRTLSHPDAALQIAKILVQTLDNASSRQ